MDTQDQINQGTWVDPAGVSWLATLEGFTDEGERAAHARIADAFRDQPILDLGVGAGRTVGLLRPLSSHYVAIDYTPVLVEATRRRHPGVDVRVGDARDLSDFDDASFSLAVFSYMGIDSVDHAGRRKILSEVHRVLRPGGVFWFSTLNMTGGAPRKRPWRPRLPSAQQGRVRRAVDLSKTLKRMPRETFNYFRVARHGKQGPGWAIAPFFAYSYGLLVHYTTLETQLSELARAGFAGDVEVLDDVHGEPVRRDSDLADVFCFNVLARK